MRFLPILAAAVLLASAVASAAALAGPTAPCSLAQAPNAAQARVQATCVTARATMSAKAVRLHEGYRLRVESNACSHFEGVIWRCRFSGFIGDIGCRGVARAYGTSRDPAALNARVTYLVCAR